MRVSTTAPLEANERAVLLQGLRSVTTREARTTWVFYSLGCHPWCLAHPKQSRIRITQEGRASFVNWRRAKTRTAKHPEMHVPLNPEIEPWLPDFLAHELGYSEREYLRRVELFGLSCGIEGLSPRTLRHDFCLRMLEATGWDVNTAQTLTGTTASILLGYARRRNVTAASEAIRARGFA